MALPYKSAGDRAAAEAFFAGRAGSKAALHGPIEWDNELLGWLREAYDWDRAGDRA